MKKVLTIFLLSCLLPDSFSLMAQSWVTGGNALTANGTVGTTTNFSVVFKTNNSERGRITNGGLWGFGTTVPNSKIHINSAIGEIPLRVQVNGSTKFWVDNGTGGVAIGNNAIPPTNGLFVSGNTGIGTPSPENTLHVFKGSAGSVTGHVNAPLIVENSTHSYINILAPDANETGILFGKPANNVDGGILYNSAGTLKGLQFRTNGNLPRMILTGDGNLGVGADPSFYKLKITHTTGFSGGLAIGDSGFPDVWELFNEIELAVVFNNAIKGRFGSADGSYSSTSDERLKTNIKPMGATLDKIMQLKPSTYQFKNTTDKQEYNGFVAQDVMKLFPSMVTHSVNPARNWDVYTMNYSQFGVLAIKGIQELQPVIEEQKEKIAALEGTYKLKITMLEDRLAKLEAALAAITANKNGNVSNVVINASLEQNKPNPFNNNTTIYYSIPRGSKGQINIYDQTGKIVKTLDANESGRSELSGYDLTAGTYTYTLLINGKIALSKQMLVIR
jgi:Chaperone of endosialidase/Secretion system C-terminal sorting domain